MKQDIFTKINAAKERRDKDISDLREALVAEKKKAEEATTSMNKATDAAAYAKAKAEKTTAEDKAEFYTMQINAQKKKPLFNDDERKAIIAEVSKHVDSVQETKLKEAADLLLKVSELVNDVRKEYTDANAAFDLLAENTGRTPIHTDMMSLSGLANPIEQAKRHVFIRSFFE